MEVHWLEQRGSDVPPQDDWLSAAELMRLAGMRVEKRRVDWRLGRWTAKAAIAAHMRTPALSGPGSAPPATRADPWRPFRISCGPRVFDGWWRPDGQLVHTVVTAPPSPAPSRLDVCSAVI